jgi:hypothetical protein
MENNTDEISLYFETIKKFNKQGKAYFNSRELCTALGYSSYQKFLKLITKCIEILRDEDDHFNHKVEMVKIGSGAQRKIESFDLSPRACYTIAKNADKKKPQVTAAITYFSRTDVDFDGAECDLNCHTSLSEEKRESIRAKNLQYWQKLNTEASVFYQEKMKILEDVNDLKRDDSFLGNKAPHHMMYKLGMQLKSVDGCRAYEFLIEYDINEPTVGIYYGCKGLILNGDIDEQIDKFNKEWKAIKDEVTTILNNTFPGKEFNIRFKPTNNANNNTYWPFWITLYEDEDIVEVAVRATRIIKRVYSKYIPKGVYDFDYKIDQMEESNQNSKTAEEKGKKRYPTVLAFTEKAYNDLAKNKGDNDDILEKLDFFTSQASSEELKIITKNEDYEKAWNATDDTTLFAYIIKAFFTKLNNAGIYKKNGTPWEAVCRVFLDIHGKSFGDGVLKNSINECKKKTGQKKHRAYEKKAEEELKRIYVK